jgi:hypothetical protein
MAPHTRVSRRPQLPAFCRTRRQATTVTISSLSGLRTVLNAVVLLQLSTLLLVLADPQPKGIAPEAANAKEVEQASQGIQP